MLEFYIHLYFYDLCIGLLSPNQKQYMSHYSHIEYFELSGIKIKFIPIKTKQCGTARVNVTVSSVAVGIQMGPLSVL